MKEAKAYACARCGVSLGLSKHFLKNCKDCAPIIQRQQNADRIRAYRQANTDLVNAKRRSDYAKNPEAGRAPCRRYHGEHRDRLAAKKRAAYALDPAAQVAKAVAWARANPESISHKNRIRKARNKGAPGTYTAVQFDSVCAAYGWSCAYCKAGLTKATVTADHAIPLVRGGSNFIGNIVPACMSCNCSKQSKTIAEFRKFKGWSAMCL